MPTRRSAGAVELVSLSDPMSPWEKTAATTKVVAATTPTPPIVPDAPPPAKRAKKTKNPRSLEVLLHGKRVGEVATMMRDRDIMITDGTKFTIHDVTCDTDPTGRALREFNFHLKVHASQSTGWMETERDRVYSGRRMMTAVCL